MSLQRLVFVAAAMLLVSIAVASAADNELQFDVKGRFKIVQFTDIHWKKNSSKGKKTLHVMTHILESEAPDLVLLTGDIVTSKPAKKGWEAVIKPMVDRKIPWAVTLGNHDDEHDLTRQKIISLLETKPGSLVSRGPKYIAGEGNFVLRIKSRQDKSKDAAILYCIDSLAYTKIYLAMSRKERRTHKHDKYAWIEPSQIEWYRENSKEITRGNAGKPLPSLAFFHIPLPEFNAAWDNTSPPPVGDKRERVSCPARNSGLFSAMVDCRDIMGVFVGHDHENDYAGIVRGICVAYGRAIGFDAYGKLPKGARVIELIEGERAFDTWIRTENREIVHLIHYPATFDKTSVQREN